MVPKVMKVDGETLLDLLDAIADVMKLAQSRPVRSDDEPFARLLGKAKRVSDSMVKLNPP